MPQPQYISLLHHVTFMIVQALWNFGSQATNIEEEWNKMHLPVEKPRDLSGILERAGPLVIVAANGGEHAVCGLAG